MPSQGKAPAPCNEGPEAEQIGCSASTVAEPPPEISCLARRYPLQAAADALALMRWDHDQAGGYQQLAEALGCHRSELLQHRWRLQVLQPLETYHCPEVRHG